MTKRSHSITIRDVAKQAGVSVATVSRYINRNAPVSGEIAKRIQRVMEKLDYVPHAAARTLASQRSSILGLILPHSVSFFFTDPYYAHLTKGIAQSCNQHDYTLALFLVDSKEDEETIFSRVCCRGLLDGVVVQSGHHGDQGIIGRLIDANMPLIVLGRPFRSDNVSYIDIDNVNASYCAVSHLARLGRRRIGTIAGPANSTVGLDRMEGYRKALVERGLDVDESLINEGDFTEAGGYYAMQKLLPAKPDAIFAASDIMAIGAIHAVHEAGLRVPDDIAFVGFDDLPLATLSDVQLTTVRQPVAQFGIRAVETLIDEIENGNTPPRRIIMDTELVIRQSCGCSV
jgi:LacI family transcriptional regulator